MIAKTILYCVYLTPTSFSQILQIKQGEKVHRNSSSLIVKRVDYNGSVVLYYIIKWILLFLIRKIII